MKPETEEIRLQKYLAMAGLGSRRQCEALIESGKIRVNQQKNVELGIKVKPGQDRVFYKGKLVELQEPLTLIFHKPRGFTCQDDPRYPEQSINFIDPMLRKTPVLIGLERQASGLILLSNEGDLHQVVKKKLHLLQRKLQIRVMHKIAPKEERRLLSGMSLNKGKLKLEKIQYMKADGNNRHWYEMTLFEHRDKMLEELFMNINHPIQRLVQVGLAGIHDGHLRKSKARILTFKEKKLLHHIIGIKSDD